MQVGTANPILGERDKLDADTAYERMCRLAERINDLTERVFALIPQSYFPRVCVLN